MKRAQPIPRNAENNYSKEAIEARQKFLTERTGAELTCVGSYSIDPSVTAGNVENFIGTLQMPLGVAGPMHIQGEHARGDFYIPLATTEGTLVASYSRGMRVISECGGVKTTVVKHSMQRAPVFTFEDALQARDFGEWLVQEFDAIKREAETTTSSGKLIEIEQYPVGNLLYTRFCYTTGDAAGQNMTGKATFAACEWINKTHPLKPGYILSGGIDTDKKHSQMNMIRTRGKRVIAEFTLKREVALERLGVDTRQLAEFRQIGSVAALQAGSAYSGAHAANGIAALFIATGQDEANVAESHASLVHAEITPEGDYYYSVTLPSLIVATYGGGTGLATQRECLEVMDCYGAGKARKLAEIVAATVLCGEVSLGAAVVSQEWVSSHDELGRNRP